MTILETLFGDFLLGLIQSPWFRWGMAFVASFWVWATGNRHAVLRLGYLLAPFVLAVIIELIDLRWFGAGGPQGGWFPVVIWSKEALRSLSTLVGFGTLLFAAFLGLTRGIGYLFTMSAFVTAYFAEKQIAPGVSFFSGELFGTLVAMLPAILIVHLTFYGIGALIRRFWEKRHAAR